MTAPQETPLERVVRRVEKLRDDIGERFGSGGNDHICSIPISELTGGDWIRELDDIARELKRAAAALEAAPAPVRDLTAEGARLPITIAGLTHEETRERMVRAELALARMAPAPVLSEEAIRDLLAFFDTHQDHSKIKRSTHDELKTLARTKDAGGG